MRVSILAAAAGLAVIQSAALAQGGVNLHVHNRWRECSFQIDPSLTQSAWRQFTGEAGMVVYFRPLSDAKPMGRGKFEVSMLQWDTGIEDEDAAWNDTFVHPDSAHWLFEGDGLKFPGLMIRAGVSEKTDAGFYITKAPGANYGFVGGQVQYAFARGTTSDWAASTRWSFTSIYGPEDLDFTVYGADVLVSRRFAVLNKRAYVSPYAVLSASLSRAHEKTAVVALDDENVLGAHATVGASAQVGAARLGIDYSFARVNSLSMKIGFGR
jgi:hypothetical protein